MSETFTLENVEKHFTYSPVFSHYIVSCLIMVFECDYPILEALFHTLRQHVVINTKLMMSLQMTLYSFFEQQFESGAGNPRRQVKLPTKITFDGGSYVFNLGKAVVVFQAEKKNVILLTARMGAKEVQCSLKHMNNGELNMRIWSNRPNDDKVRCLERWFPRRQLEEFIREWFDECEVFFGPTCWDKPSPAPNRSAYAQSLLARLNNMQ
jgi:hypothetical protein